MAGGGGKVDLDIYDPMVQNQCSSSSHRPQVNLCVKFESD